MGKVWRWVELETWIPNGKHNPHNLSFSFILEHKKGDKMKTIELTDEEIVVLVDGLNDLIRGHDYCRCSFCTKHRITIRDLTEKLLETQALKEEE